MNKNQENRFSMHKAIKKFFADNDAAFTANADITLARSLLDSQITLTESLLRTQTLDRTGHATAKNIARDIIEEHGLSIAGRVNGWAYLHQNPVLEAEMNFTKHGKTASTGLHRLADTEIAPICRTIHQRATDNLASISTITALELDTFMGFITTYENLLSAPVTEEGLAVVATEQLEPTLDRTDEILRKAFDRLMLGYSHTNATLLAQYKQTRKIIDAGLRHEEEEEPAPPAPPAPTP